MSEYQYYEFRALDRPLTKSEIAALGKVSSRAEITPTSLTNEYNFGNFRGNPDRMMDRYFDAFIHVTNWGTHEFGLRLPRGLVDFESIKRYEATDSLRVRVTGQHVHLKFRSSDEEGGGEDEGSRWMASLVPLREDLLRGDFRSLYLGWLQGASSGEFDDDAVEPPIPPGLSKLTAPLKALADYLRIEDDVLEAAAEISRAAPVGPTGEELTRLVAALPNNDKTAWLTRLALAETPNLRLELLRHLHAAGGAPAPQPATPSRTVGELRAGAEAAAEAERQRNAGRAAQRAKAAARKRAEHLADLAKRETQAWGKAEKLVSTKVQANYDVAVELLRDLREIAAQAGRESEAREKTSALRARHASKSSFTQRLRRAGLLGSAKTTAE